MKFILFYRFYSCGWGAKLAVYVIGDFKLERVDSFTYLGSLVSREMTLEEEIDTGK